MWQRRLLGLVAAAILGLPSQGVAAAGLSGGQLALTGPLPADVSSPVFQVARLTLEMRRAGGPRESVMVGILGDEHWQNSSQWSYQLLRACEKRLVDCNQFLKVLDGLPDRVSARESAAVAHDVKSIRREAYLQSLPLEKRRELYEAALRRAGTLVRRGATVDPVTDFLSDVDAADRVITEGIVELQPLVAELAASPTCPGREITEARLLVLRAGLSEDPAKATLAIIRAGVEADIKAMLSEPDATSMPMPDRSSLSAATLSLQAIRKLAPRDGSVSLRQIFYLYGKVKAADRQARESNPGGGPRAYSPSREVPAEKGIRGHLVMPVLEAIGDLGDREYERRMLGEYWNAQPLWDRVQKAEVTLEVSGQFREDSAVAR